jgi:CMP-2-keto-3-deoxyoctulosonic acid synthetase
MSAKAISEASGKRLLNQFLTTAAKSKFASVSHAADFDRIAADNNWLSTQVLLTCFNFFPHSVLFANNSK